ncbi:MAG: hypothetical protein U9N85_11015 [Bacteroidota bacterium]|nr:hypothetical protein [Bacteroidota bacterium]
MSFTIKITENTPQSLSIVNMLKALAIDYKFLQILEDDFSSELTPEQEKELDSRYEYVLKNPTVGKSWYEVKQNLLSK